MSGAYYNEIDPFCAEWLRNLIAAGHIAPGDVDERDIRDVRPDDLRPYTQCHFFAGIGVWSRALRTAGWGDDRPVWTGSCPCQPFSQAGRRGGTSDERHLWPHWFHLVGERRPPAVLGEQVASKDGLGWLDLVQADLEGAGYAVGAVDTCSAGSGAPHIRQRLRFVAQRMADADDDEGPQGLRVGGDGALERAAGPRDVDGGLADADGRDAGAERKQRGREHGQQPQDGRALRMADDATVGRREERPDGRGLPEGDRAQGVAAGSVPGGDAGRPGPTNGFWRDADWLFCRDGKWRPVEPGTFPLAHGAASRVGRLRAYGNAVDAEATRHFVEACIDALDAGSRAVVTPSLAEALA